MPVALLDHPWPLDAGLEPGSPAVGVLLGYENLLRRYLLRPARFVTTDEYQELMQNLGTRRGGGRQDIIRLAHQLLRIEEDGPLATPEPEPRPPLSESWKRALRAEIEG